MGIFRNILGNPLQNMGNQWGTQPEQGMPSLPNRFVNGMMQGGTPFLRAMPTAAQDSSPNYENPNESMSGRDRTGVTGMFSKVLSSGSRFGGPYQARQKRKPMAIDPIYQPMMK